MNKKMFSMGVVMALLFALTIPVGAVMDSPADSGTVSVENDYDGSGASENAPTSEEGTAEDAKTALQFTPDVQIPDTMRIVFNPYRMQTIWNGEATNDAVLSEVVFVSSQDANSLRLNLSVSGVPEEECQAVPVSSPEELGGDIKQVFVWFEFQPVIDREDLIWNGTYAEAKNQIAVNDEDGKTVILPAAQDGETVRLAIKAFAEFYIPSGMMWTSKDTIHFNVRCFFESLNDDEAQKSITDTGALQVTEDIEAVEPSEVAQPVENAKPSDVAETIKDAEPSDVTEPVEDAEPSGDTESGDDAEASNVTEPAKNAQLSDDTEPVEDAEPSSIAAPVEDAEASDDTEPVEDAQPSDDTEPVNAESSDDTEPIENGVLPDEAPPVDEEPSDVAEPVEDAQSSDVAEPSNDTQPVEDVEPSDVKEPVEDVELSDDIQSDEDAEPFDDIEPPGEPTDFSQD